EFKGAESLENPQLNRIIVNGRQLPSDLLKWKYRSRRLHDYLSDYRNIHGIGTSEVRDGKVILRSRTEERGRLLTARQLACRSVRLHDFAHEAVELSVFLFAHFGKRGKSQLIP